MRNLAFALALLTLSEAGAARADALPEPEYVETCTLAQHARPGRECRSCRWYYEYPEDHCAAEVGEGFVKACRTEGGPWRTEIWCRDASTPPNPATTETTSPPSDPPPAAPASDDADDCSTAPTASLVWPSLLALAAFVARRRTRSVG